MIGTTVGKYRIVALLGCGATGNCCTGRWTTRLIAKSPSKCSIPPLRRRRHPQAISIRSDYSGEAESSRDSDDSRAPPDRHQPADGDGAVWGRDARRSGRRPRRAVARFLAGHIVDGILSALEHAITRHPSPRYQARQRDGHRRGRHQDHGLRHRARPRRRAEDRRLPRDGHAGLHVARAGDGRGSRRPQRSSISVGRAVLSSDQRRAAVHRRHRTRHAAAADSAIRRRRSTCIARVCRHGATVVQRALAKSPADRFQSAGGIPRRTQPRDRTTSRGRTRENVRAFPTEPVGDAPSAQPDRYRPIISRPTP